MCICTGIDILRLILIGISLTLTIIGVIKHNKHEYNKSMTCFAMAIAINIVNFIIGKLAI